MENSEFTGLSQIGQISVPVRDLNRAVDFYRTALGMKYLFQAPGMAFFDCGGIRLLLSLPEDETGEQKSSIIYYKVEDIEVAAQALRDKDVEIISEPHLIAEMPDHDLWMAFFQDPDENTLALMSEIPRPGDR